MRHRVLGGIALQEYQQKTGAANATPVIFRRKDLSLVGCSPAVPTSVLAQLCKIQYHKLYLQPVKFRSHLTAYFHSFLICFWYSRGSISV
jgi:hypothetical protein